MKRNHISYPKNIENAYSLQLRREIESYHNDIIKIIKEDYKSVFADTEELTDFFNKGMFTRLLARILDRSFNYLNKNKSESLATSYVNSLKRMNDKKVKKSLKLGSLDVLKYNHELEEYLEYSVKANQHYIGKLKDNHNEKINGIIIEAIRNGETQRTVEKQIKEATGMAERYARFIAQDQTGRIYGDLNAKRGQDYGAIGFIWHDSNDSKVRPDHKNRDGKLFYFKDKPKLPGEDIRCRCSMEWIFADDDLTKYEEG